MNSLKINLDDNANSAKIAELLMQIKGIRSIEMISSQENENDIMKAVHKTKSQLKSGDYEALVNDFLEVFTNKK